MLSSNPAGKGNGSCYFTMNLQRGNISFHRGKKAFLSAKIYTTFFTGDFPGQDLIHLAFPPGQAGVSPRLGAQGGWVRWSEK